jgi:hypothetical protein
MTPLRLFYLAGAVVAAWAFVVWFRLYDRGDSSDALAMTLVFAWLTLDCAFRALRA